MRSRFEAFALAAVLAVTVVTGGVALAGMRHSSAPHATTPVVAQVVPAAALTSAPPHEMGDA
jgi:hypothetical protein